ncbi:DUF177 domain-containing protein [Alcaligenaceae bacterium]|nr:DUF177 domain-containing protein [Alcaligenaceae bacterium]
MQYVDTNEITRLGQEVTGQTPVAQFVRLIEDLPPQPEAVVTWSITGSSDLHGQRFLALHVQGDLTLECQRCMGTVVWPIDSHSTLQVVRTQEALELEDDQDLDDPDDVIERIMGSPRLDVLELVEDELILSLPYVAKHDACPTAFGQQDALDDTIDTGRPSPFAVLSQLKKD